MIHSNPVMFDYNDQRDWVLGPHKTQNPPKRPHWSAHLLGKMVDKEYLFGFGTFQPGLILFPPFLLLQPNIYEECRHLLRLFFSRKTDL